MLLIGVILCLLGVREIVKKANHKALDEEKQNKLKINPQDDYMNADEDELSVCSLL